MTRSASHSEVSEVSVVPQHLQALDRAREVQRVREYVKAHLATLPTRDGVEAVCAILRHPTPESELETLPVARLIGWIHRYGPERARLVCMRTQTQVNRSLVALTERQRDALCAALRGES